MFIVTAYKTYFKTTLQILNNNVQYLLIIIYISFIRGIV